MKVVFIYGLIDPFTNEVRYVGKSINPKRRYKEHLNKMTNTHKSAWIKSLLKIGKEPKIEIIEECSGDNWSDREKYWISFYGNLTNLTEGGEDGSHSEETIQKLRLLNSGVNNPNYGKRASKDLRDKLSEIQSGKSLTETHKGKIKKSMKKRPIVIDGVKYESTRDAHSTLKGVNIYYRLKSDKYPNYYYS